MRYVIGLDTALKLIQDRTAIPAHHSLVAPTLLRSEILADLYRAVQRQDFDRKEAVDRLDHMQSLKIRLLGDRVLQRAAWDIAEQLGWDSTLPAEYVALTKLQADAFVTLDPQLARTIDGIVPLATYEEMTGWRAR